MAAESRQQEMQKMNAEAQQPVKVMVYSDDRTVREQVRLALGKRVARDLPELVVLETATAPALYEALRQDPEIALMILDSESTPAGGMGVCHEIKDTFEVSPPAVLLVARQADAWMATWSRAEAMSGYPVDPVRLPTVVADVLRRHVVAAG